MQDPAKNSTELWGEPLTGAGARPHPMRRGLRPFVAAYTRGVAVAAMLAMFGSEGCAARDETRTLGPYTLAITDATKPALKSAQGGGVYETQVAIALPLIDRPEITGESFKPYPAALWYTSSDLQVQLTYVITNLGDAPITVELTVDGWNEFIRYTPAVKVDDEGNVVADRACDDRILDVPAHGRVTGTISYDDFERIATALATIMGGAPNPFHAVEPHTHLRQDPLTAAYVPAVIDGLTGFDLSLRAGAAQKVALEATLEIQDHQSLLVPAGSESKARPPGKRYRPALPKAAGP